MYSKYSRSKYVCIINLINLLVDMFFLILFKSLLTISTCVLEMRQALSEPASLGIDFNITG